MPTIDVAAIRDNLYRDRAVFPTSPAKIESLIESMEQTGFWDNVMVRFRNNDIPGVGVITDHLALAELLEAGELDLSACQFELAYGHHRIDAIRKMGITEINIPIKLITDEDMLRIMSNENKEGWGAGLNSKLETVRQVRAQLSDQLKDMGSFTEYQDFYGDDAIFSNKQFMDAKTHGIGYRTIQAFLGASWSQADVRIPLACFSAIDKGYFSQEQIIDVPSLGLLDALSAQVIALYEGGKVKEMVPTEVIDPETKKVVMVDGKPKMKDVSTFVTKPAPAWPVFVKEGFVKAMIASSMPKDYKDAREDQDIEYCKEAGITQSQLNARRVAMLKEGKSPLGGKDKFSVHKAVVADYFKGFDAKAPNEERERLYAECVGADMDAFKAETNITEWAGWDALLEALLNKFEVLKTPLEDTEQQEQELQAQMDKAENSTEDQETPFDDLNIQLETTDADGGIVLEPIGKVGATIIKALQFANDGVAALAGREADIDFGEDPNFQAALVNSIQALSVFYGTVTSVEDLKAVLVEAMENVQNSDTEE